MDLELLLEAEPKDWKDTALAELEAALILINFRKAKLDMRAKLARQAKTNENPCIRPTEIINNYFPESNKNYNIKDFSKPDKKKDPLLMGEKEDMLFYAAQHSARNSGAFGMFRELANQLKSEGDNSALETLLKAAHNVSVTKPELAEDFLSTMFLTVPEQDRAAYAAVVSNLFRVQTAPMGWNPLVRELSQILSKPFYPIFDIKQELNDIIDGNPNKSIDKLTTSKQEYSFQGEHFLGESLSGGVFINGGTVDSLIGSHVTGGLFINREAANFFSELRGIYQTAGSENARGWLALTNALLTSEYEKGKDFSIRSRPALIAYVHNLGWGLEQFKADYESLGNELFGIPDLLATFSGMAKPWQRELIRELIDGKDTETLRLLSGIRLPAGITGAVVRSLPINSPIKKVAIAMQEAQEIYYMCSNNQVGKGLVNSRLLGVSKAGSLEDYLRKLETVKKDAARYIEFANEQRKDSNMNLGFNDDQAQAALGLYEGFLGKSLEQFIRDFAATGTALQMLPQIREKYSECIGEDRLKAVMNYVAKQRSRDLIDNLSINPAANDFIKQAMLKLGNSAGKREIVRTLAELNKAYNFLKEFGDTQVLSQRLSEIPDNSGYDALAKAISGSRGKYIEKVTGGLEVPEGLEDMVDNIAIAYHKNTGEMDARIQPALRLIASNYLQHGAKETFQAISRLKPNQKLRKKMIKRGIDITAFEIGISRTYQVSTDEGSLTRLRERIDAEVQQAYDRLGNLKLEEGKLEELKDGSIREQLDKVEKFLAEYEFDDETIGLKPEIKGHVQTARSITGTIKEMSTSARFYVSNDPFEALHMGQYFGSCLSLAKDKYHGGCNGWASVVQTMDSNKNVIYARAEDGRYLGRNRTALTDQGVLCTRFYQNGNMNLNEAWIEYLGDFAEQTKQDVIIPAEFTPLSMKSILERKVQEGKAVREKKAVKIEPAYFSAFYGDGLKTTKSIDGTISVSSSQDFYVIKPNRGDNQANPCGNKFSRGLRSAYSRLFK